MDRNSVQVDYEHNYHWRSVSGYRLSDQLILTASPDFAGSNPPSTVDVSVAGQPAVRAIPIWADRSCGAALFRIDGPPPAPPVNTYQWGELETVRGRVGCEVRYAQPGVVAVQRFPGFLDPRRRDAERSYLLDARSRPRAAPVPEELGGSASPPMTGGAVICGRDAFSGLVIADRGDELVILPADRLFADRSFVEAYEQTAHRPIARGPVRGHAPAAYAAVLALPLAVAAYYVNFLQTAAQVTATIVDVFVLSLLAWRFLIWLLQARHEVGPRRFSVWKTCGIAAAVAGASVLTGLTWTPGGSEDISAPYCLYNVSAHNPPADSFPITKGGYVEQAFIPTASMVDAISPVVGIDSSYSHPGIAHPMTLELTDAGGTELVPPISVTNISDNGFTRFNLPEPLRLDLHTTYYIRLTNSSAETVGIYLDPTAEEGDEVNDPDRGAWIVGQAAITGGYRKPGWALSGCIEAISAA